MRHLIRQHMRLPHPLRNPLGLLSAALLGVAAAVLVACGGSSSGLIPTQQAGPLQSDFEAVAQAAQVGNGNCAGTREAIAKTEQDYQALPATVDRGLRETLRKGIANLSTRARGLCAQPIASSATTTNPITGTSTTSSTRTSTQSTDTTASSSTTSTQSTPTTTVTTPTTTATTPAPGGGTPAGGEGGLPGNGNPGEGGSGNGGAGAGGAGAGGGGAGSGQGAPR